MSRTKTYYFECKFSEVTPNVDGEASLVALVLQKKGSFKHLGSIIQDNGEVDDHVTHCISAGWKKWRLISRVLYDKNVHQNLNGSSIEW